MDAALLLVVFAESIFLAAHAVVGSRHGWSNASETRTEIAAMRCMVTDDLLNQSSDEMHDKRLRFFAKKQVTDSFP